MPDRSTPSGSGRRLGLARVHGRSMEPTLHEGDRLVVLHGARPRVGRLAVVRLPGEVLAVKRVTRREPSGWWVERDNPREGVDSWSVGAVPDADVLAVVLLRVWSPDPSRPGHVGRVAAVTGVTAVAASLAALAAARCWCRLRHIRTRPRSG
ncbi:S24 family peptidase [Nocardioides mesophilus]|uniref:S24 family peptidase n=1 Tax=Nocardioides mesophilus TaxID=433659 RepID=A0A7G9R8L8_9ACTN|nr:S24 family peptidase [Nocardioides mesophilus]QNN51943.1 S24 family peptidase [Nocardioides mesophilus]